MSVEAKKMRWINTTYLASLFIVSLITIAIHIKINFPEIVVKNACIQENQQQILPDIKENFMTLPEDALKESKVVAAAADGGSGGGGGGNYHHPSVSTCDFFSGRWVFDNESKPLYEEAQCTFMKPDYACQKYGRKNLNYLKWVWKPHDCQLPRFNGKKLMEKIRGKRVVFVGDSLNRNQWTSLLCMIESSLHHSSEKTVVRNDNLFVFNAIEYNATIEFYWSPLLVESNSDDPYNHSIKNGVIIRLNSIEKHARLWNDADILIFDNFMWWIKKNMSLLWGSFGSEDAIHKVVEKTPRLYEMCLNTWSDWLEMNINRNKTKLFFMSLSPYHYNGEVFEDGKQCYNVMWPETKENYRGAETDRRMMETAEAVIERLEGRGLHVGYLNITQLSDYRKDGHTSINKKYFTRKTREDLHKNPKTYADCVHWCLPGVPDVWNQILYHYIINS